MPAQNDPETGELGLEDESQSLLPVHQNGGEKERTLPIHRRNSQSAPSNWNRVLGAFFAGIICTLLGQYLLPVCSIFDSSRMTMMHGDNVADKLASPDVGSTTRHGFPPPSPTNAFPELFPIDVGFPGPTPTGGEAGSVATAPAYPPHLEVDNLVQPASLPKAKGKWEMSGEGFNMFRSWGNLSPWYSVPSERFGLKGASANTPEGCEITGLHLLHRHGARYPTNYTSYGGPSVLASRLRAANKKQSWTAKGDLEFLNNWTYKLGEEILTPFGRQQLYDLGVSMRIKYGFLLEDFTKSNTIPVFRTESQDRMLKSAENFALGFFGWPLDGKYQQVVMIEANGFNNTLAPYKTCKNANDRKKADRGTVYLKKWAKIYLQAARKRLNALIEEYEFTIEDVYTMQQMCAYETVAIGYSAFCELFTQEEWEGFDYGIDVNFWYNSGFGSPVARVQGIGYVKELLARLTHTRIPEHDTSTNATLDDDERTFPLHQSLYVDATHEVVVLNVLTALNLSNFAANGSLPVDHIPPNRSFRTSELCPFGTNVQFQLLSCSAPHPTEPQIRIVVNDGVTVLTGIDGCRKSADGLCDLGAFVKAQQSIVERTDWKWDCDGDWKVPPLEEWETVTGDPPPRS